MDQIAGKVYNYVTEDVISATRDIFIHEGIDEQVLQQLKSLWRSKLLASKVVDIIPEESDPDKKDIKSNAATNNIVSVTQSETPGENFSQGDVEREIQGRTAEEQTTQQTSNQDQIVVVHSIIEAAKNIPLKVPQLDTLLTSPMTNTTKGLSSETQQHSPAALQDQQLQLTMKKVPFMDDSCNVEPKKKRKKTESVSVELIPADGVSDTSDEDDDSSEDNSLEDKISEEEEEDDQELDENAVEEEPLNSNDDITDEESASENIVVCQFNDIVRSGNNWKFNLKHGIMTLNGKDYIFHKAKGDADW